MVRLRCEKCGRFGQYRRARLLAEHGDLELPALRLKLVDCERRDRYHDPCGAHFPDLVPRAAPAGRAPPPARPSTVRGGFPGGARLITSRGTHDFPRPVVDHLRRFFAPDRYGDFVIGPEDGPALDRMNAVWPKSIGPDVRLIVLSALRETVRLVPT
jgi:hypothetical protein